jgi:hypothetical protein
MAGVGPTDLHDSLAVDTLAAAVEALDTVPTYAPALGGAPERQYIAPGQVAIDCEQVTVFVGPLTEGASAPTPPRASFARINRVALIITVVRCVPTVDNRGVPPSPEAMQEAAAQINADKWALWNHLYNMIRNDQLFERCCDVIWGQLQPLAQQGGFGGSVLAINVCFEGYDEAFGT